MPRRNRFRHLRRSRPPGQRINRRTIVRHRFTLLLIGFLALVALGIGLERLESVARERSARADVTGESETSLLDPINPFLVPPAVRQTASTDRTRGTGQSAGDAQDVSQP